MLFTLSLLCFSAGIIMIIVSLWALRKNSGARKILALLSPILTYGVLVFTLLLTPKNSFLWQIVLMFIVALCIIVNVYTLYSFWNWIEPKKKKTLFIFLSAITLVSIIICLFALPAAQFCAKTSLPGKGALIEDIQYCQNIGFYNPVDHPWFEAFPLVAMTTLTGPVCAYIFLTIMYIISIYKKSQKKKVN